MSNFEDYIEFTHRDVVITTIDGFVFDPTSIVRGWTAGALLRYEDQEGILNIDRVFGKYTQEEQAENRDAFFKDKELILSFTQEELAVSSVPLELELLKPNTVFVIPKDRLSREAVIGEGKQVVKEEFDVFLANKLKELLQDIAYFPVQKTSIKNLGGVTKAQFPRVSVWLWSRALSIPNSGLESEEAQEEAPEGTIINLSPYIINQSTSVTKTGGSFSLSLPPLIGRFDKEKGWVIKEGSLSKFKDIEHYVSEGDVHRIEEGERKRNHFYFHNIIGENDIVFIRFETLNAEIEKRIINNNKAEINKNELPGNIYDMIGLVDSAPIIYNAENSSVTINVNGRDLIKVLIEDSCIFHPTEFLAGGLAANDNSPELLQRVEGKIHGLTQTAEKSIEFTLKFIFNALSNNSLKSFS